MRQRLPRKALRTKICGEKSKIIEQHMIDSFGVFFCADGLVRLYDHKPIKLCFTAIIWWSHGMGMMTGKIIINYGYYAPPAICLQIPSSWRQQHLHQFHLINIIHYTSFAEHGQPWSAHERPLPSLSSRDGSLSLSMNHHRIMTLHHIRPFSLPRSMKIIWTLFQNN